MVLVAQVMALSVGTTPSSQIAELEQARQRAKEAYAELCGMTPGAATVSACRQGHVQSGGSLSNSLSGSGALIPFGSGASQDMVLPGDSSLVSVEVVYHNADLS